MINTFVHYYRVRHNETDFTGRMSLPAFGDCLLDIAGLHAMDIGTGIDTLQHQGLTWVIAGMKFKMSRLPLINDRFNIETHVSAYSRISTQRDFVAYDNSGKFAEVSSEWLIIDMNTRRPVFINEVLPQLESVCVSEGMLPKFKHLRPCNFDVAAENERTIGYSDLDVNRHLYSMRYLQMALDTFGTEAGSVRRIAEVDINFVSEVLGGEQVRVVRRSNGNVHDIEMLRDGKAVFRAEFVTEN
ncbi:MAG: hypothetical protein K6F33_06405 [Bacteroidales bacterium]|nr:hypothetical protein [Bacteroidales bacterium]